MPLTGTAAALDLKRGRFTESDFGHRKRFELAGAAVRIAEGRPKVSLGLNNNGLIFF